MSKSRRKNPSLVELESFFKKYEPSEGAFILDQCTTIDNQKEFIALCIYILKGDTKRHLKIPYYFRLVKYYRKIKIIQNVKKHT